MRRVLGLIAVALLAYPVLVAALGAAYLVVPPVSTLMLGRWLTGRQADRTYVPLSAVAPAVTLAAIASEDARFCTHRGVDWAALSDVMDEADEGGPSRGPPPSRCRSPRTCSCGRAAPTSARPWSCRSPSISG